MNAAVDLFLMFTRLIVVNIRPWNYLVKKKLLRVDNFNDSSCYANYLFKKYLLSQKLVPFCLLSLRIVGHRESPLHRDP